LEVLLTTNLTHNGQPFRAGSVVDLPLEVADALLASDSARIPTQAGDAPEAAALDIELKAAREANAELRTALADAQEKLTRQARVIERLSGTPDADVTSGATSRESARRRRGAKEDEDGGTD
jgi:predicted  nucleic acid-binding Zn-ribbon protein